jgi:hypothetical protein
LSSPLSLPTRSRRARWTAPSSAAARQNKSRTPFLDDYCLNQPCVCLNGQGELLRQHVCLHG